MIVLRLKADNLSCFKDFDINFVYKKKNNSSTIKNEYLSFCKSFNYKKINIIYGNNASGKTSLGLLLCDIFNFIFKKYTDGLFELVNDEKRQSYFMLDFICDKKTVNRVECIIDANKKIKMRFCFASIKRNYEFLEPELDYYINSKSFSDDLRELDYFNNFGGWRFLFPSTDMNKIFCDFGENKNYKIEYCDILTRLLTTFDKNILFVSSSKDTNDAIVITFKNNKKVIIQDGMNIEHIPLLSSGTKYAINIAYILICIKYNLNGFYFIDEQFSYISSELENVLLSLMIEYLKDDCQLFFTTHNLELLDKMLPKHSYLILKQNEYGNTVPIYIEKHINKNNQSLKNLYINDYFNNFPNTSEIESLYEK